MLPFVHTGPVASATFATSAGFAFSTAGATGAFVASSTLTATSSVTFSSTLTVTSAVTFSGSVVITGSLVVSGTVLHASGAAEGAEAFLASNQNVSTGSTAIVIFDTENRDDNGYYSVATNPSRVTAQGTGWYMAQGQVNWSATTAVLLITGLLVNGTDYHWETSRTGHLQSDNRLPVAGPLYLSNGDYLQLTAFHNAASALLLISEARLALVRWR